MLHVFPYRDGVARRKEGNGGCFDRGIGELQHSVRSRSLGNKHEIGSLKFGFRKGVIATEHLIAAIQHVECLLSPRTILIVGVHTKTKGSDRHVVDLFFDAFQTMRLDGKRIKHGNESDIEDFDRLVAQDLEITSRGSYKILNERIFSLGASKIKGKITGADEVSDKTVRQMLSVRDLDVGCLRAICLDVKISAFFVFDVIDASARHVKLFGRDGR